MTLLRMRAPSPSPSPAAPIAGAEQYSAGERARLSGPGLRTFLAIAEAWRLDEATRLAVLGGPGRSTYFGWVAKARAGAPLSLSIDTLTRISAVLGIFKALKILFPRDGDALEWLQSPNSGPVFGGQPPLAVISAGSMDGLMQARRHLDGWRGGIFSAPLEGVDEAPPLTDADIVWA